MAHQQQDSHEHHHHHHDHGDHGDHEHGHGEPATHDDWLKYWEQGEDDWEHSIVDQFLIKYLDRLTAGNKRATILVPLCGTSVDIKWLCEQGYKVVGVELAEAAAKLFFTKYKLEYKVTTADNGLTVYEGFNGNLKYVVGDFFVFNKDMYGTFDCLWDLNSFDPINKDDKQRYVDHCHSLLKPNGPILLGSYIFDDHYCGPMPVTLDTIQSLYGNKFTVEHLELTDITMVMRDTIKDVEWKPNKIEETVFIMTRKN